jgi:5-methylcytosine-specific restriction endonuclease McrA
MVYPINGRDNNKKRYTEKRESILSYKAIYYRANKSKFIAKSRKRYLTKKAEIIESIIQWRKMNPDKVKKYAKISCDRARANPLFRLSHTIKVSIRHSLKHKKSGVYWEKAVGYTLHQLIKHLEKQFSPAMNWDNWGTYWEIDHIIPISAHNFSSVMDIDFKRCWALANLRPLEKSENHRKNNKLLRPFQPSLIAGV